ncbi:hypothetical protein PIIN_11122 [Serendipita indica DSM 11827]|uniref:F-box domain-containing protein n=1 Tax=Serendipita indica (strain DSM 11827) TaxID=1109443 RepID=G4U0P6_SERID|nr:hypothetical protein PIIN_11122 [Serendipita indica DSM 11827]
MHWQKLPSDIHHEVLIGLPLLQLARMRQVDRYLNNLIESSIYLRFIIELGRDGYELTDYVVSSVSIHQLLESHLNWRRNWRERPLPITFRIPTAYYTSLFVAGDMLWFSQSGSLFSLSLRELGQNGTICWKNLSTPPEGILSIIAVDPVQDILAVEAGSWS